MTQSRRFCIYAIPSAPGASESVYGFLHPTRQETIAYLMIKCPSLSAVDDDQFSFTIEGVKLDDEPGLWREVTDDLPLQPKPIIHLSLIDTLVKKEKREEDEPLADPTFLVRICYTSSMTPDVDSRWSAKPHHRLVTIFRSCANEMGRDVGELNFFLDGQLLDGRQTCAEAGVVGGSRIDVVDRVASTDGNAVAGSSTGPGTRSEGLLPLTEDVTLAVARLPAPSQPSASTRVDQSPGPRPALHPSTPRLSPVRPDIAPAASGPASVPAVTHLAAVESIADPDPEPCVPVVPAQPSVTAQGKRRADADSSPADGVGSEMSPMHQQEPSTKKARVVKEESPPPTGETLELAGEGAIVTGSAAPASTCDPQTLTVTSSSSSATSSKKRQTQDDWILVVLDYLPSPGFDTYEPLFPLDMPLSKLFTIFATHVTFLCDIQRRAWDLVFSADGRTLDGDLTCAQAGLVDGARIEVTDRDDSSDRDALETPPTLAESPSDRRVSIATEPRCAVDNGSGQSARPASAVSPTEADALPPPAEGLSLYERMRAEIAEKCGVSREFISAPALAEPSSAGSCTARVQSAALDRPADDSTTTPRTTPDHESDPIVFVDSHVSAGFEDEEDDDEARYCICQKKKKKGKLMVACDRCNEWYHPKCIGASEEKVKLLASYICPWCVERTPKKLAVVTNVAKQKTPTAAASVFERTPHVAKTSSTDTPKRRTLLDRASGSRSMARPASPMAEDEDGDDASSPPLPVPKIKLRTKKRRRSGSGSSDAESSPRRRVVMGSEIEDSD